MTTNEDDKLSMKLDIKVTPVMHKILKDEAITRDNSIASIVREAVWAWYNKKLDKELNKCQ